MKFFESKRNLTILFVTLIILVLGIWIYRCKTKPVFTDPYKDLIEKIDSLNNKIDSLEIQRDTINN